MLTVVLLWLILALLVGAAAGSRRRSGVGWFLLAILISPLFAVLLLLAFPPLPKRTFAEKLFGISPTKTCRWCGETIQRKAIVCKHCGRDLEEAPRPAPPAPHQPAEHALAPRGALVAGDGRYGFDIVGEASYQAALERTAGRRNERGARHQCHALLLPEPHNPYDANAVAVRINQSIVGYLRRDHAKSFGDSLHAAGYAGAICPAVIVGGWDDGDGDRGHFGVKLDVRLPWRFTPTTEPATTTKAAPAAKPVPTKELAAGLTIIFLVVALLVLWLQPAPPPTAVPTPVASPSVSPAASAPDARAISTPMPLPRPRPPSKPPLDLRP